MNGATTGERLTLLRKGDYLSKLGHNLHNSDSHFQLSQDDSSLRYASLRKNFEVPLANIRSIEPGRRSKGFLEYDKKKKYKDEEKFALEKVSFSIHYEVPTKKDGSKKPVYDTFNITCRGNEAEGISAQQQYELWFHGLTAAVQSLRASESTHGPRASAAHPLGKFRPPAVQIPGLDERSASETSPKGPRRQESFHSTTWSNPQTNGSLLARQGRKNGVGDPFYFGFPLAGMQQRKSADKEKHAVVRLPGSSVMDAAQAAVCATHALLVTRGGDVYTWGGHGFDEELCVRKVDGTAGRRCREVACAHGVSLALTDRGTVLSWGDGSMGTLGHGDTESCFSPKPIRNFVWSVANALSSASAVSIKQIASGPFHCAAISGGLQLFTWGDGAHGRLGHGNMEPCHEPKQVAALANARVLRVACGTYHTAAICLSAADCPYDASLESSIDFDESSLGFASTPQSTKKAHCGQLYTWGGVFVARSNTSGVGLQSASPRAGGAAGGGESKMSGGGLCLNESDNEGCLGHPDLPPKVGLLMPRPVDLHYVNDVACGETFTVTVDTHGRVHQMGSMGLPTHAACPWEGARQPTRVAGALMHTCVTHLAAGANHVIALGCPRSPDSPDEVATQAFSWGQNTHGQLGRPAPVDRGLDTRAIPAPIPIASAPVFAAAAGPATSLIIVKHGCLQAETPSRAGRGRILNLAMGPRVPKDSGNGRSLPSSRRVSSQEGPSLWSRRPSAQAVVQVEQLKGGPGGGLSRMSAGPKHMSSNVPIAASAKSRSGDSVRRRSDLNGVVISLSSDALASMPSPSALSSVRGGDSIPAGSKQSSLANEGVDWDSSDVDVSQTARTFAGPRVSGSMSENEYATRNKWLEDILVSRNITIAKLQQQLTLARQSQSAMDMQSTGSFSAPALPRSCSGGSIQDPKREQHPSGPDAAWPSPASACPPVQPAHDDAFATTAQRSLYPTNGTSSGATLASCQSAPAATQISDKTAFINGPPARPDALAELKDALEQERRARQAAEMQVQALQAQLAETKANGSHAETPLARAMRGPGPYKVGAYRWPVEPGVYAEVDVHEVQTVSKFKFSSSIFDKQGVQRWWAANKTRVAVGDVLRNLPTPKPSAASQATLLEPTPPRTASAADMAELVSPSSGGSGTWQSLAVQSSALRSMEALEEGTDSRGSVPDTDATTPGVVGALESEMSETGESQTPPARHIFSIAECGTSSENPGGASCGLSGVTPRLNGTSASHPLSAYDAFGSNGSDGADIYGAEQPAACDSIALQGFPPLMTGPGVSAASPLQQTTPRSATTASPLSAEPPLLDGGDSPSPTHALAQGLQSPHCSIAAVDGTLLVPVSGM